jgi:hypothetical protein
MYYSLRSSVPTTRNRSRGRSNLPLTLERVKSCRRQGNRNLPLVKNGKLTVSGRAAADTGDREYDQLVHSFGGHIHLSQGRPAAAKARIALKNSKVKPRSSTLPPTNVINNSVSSSTTASVNINKTRRSMTTTGPDEHLRALTTQEPKAAADNQKDERNVTAAQSKQTNVKKRKTKSNCKSNENNKKRKRTKKKKKESKSAENESPTACSQIQVKPRRSLNCRRIRRTSGGGI